MNKCEDLTGRKFGMLTVVAREPNDKHGCTRWNCDCDCGNKGIIISRQSLLRRKHINCGCVQKKYQDITGLKSGRLTAIENIGRDKRGYNIWLCQCECGNTTKVVDTALRAQQIKSCGCLKREITSLTKTKHHQSKTSLYSVWLGMKDRCYNPKCKAYKHYGERGITICDEWLGNDGSTNFFDWALSHGYKKGLELDRIDVNKGYYPDNCRWVTYLVQSNNKRTTRFITYNGETKSLADWCRQYSMPYDTVHQRLSNNWSFERAITTPVKRVANHRKHVCNDSVVQLLLEAKSIAISDKVKAIIKNAIDDIENL